MVEKLLAALSGMARAMNDRDALVRKLLAAWGDDTDDLIRLVEIIASTRDRLRRELITGWAIGFRNAAFIVRRDGGSEERAKAFDDAAAICEHNLEDVS